ncbi:multidrug efflux SMR transporter [Robertmurraya massiliosenegalensis]|uniref:DMT family transporter n=1 Tax=Robertmurraya TaxID=2837507 RepID=UPI0039A7233B
MNRNWFFLVIAAILEVVWVIGLAHAYSVWTWTGTLMALVISNYLMISAGRTLPVGTVYSVFVGLGAAGTIISEILFFDEPFKWEKIALIALLLIGVIGLKVVTDEKSVKGAES